MAEVICRCVGKPEQIVTPSPSGTLFSMARLAIHGEALRAGFYHTGRNMEILTSA